MQPISTASCRIDLQDKSLKGHQHTKSAACNFYQLYMCVQDAVKQKVKEEHDKATADNTVDKLVVWSGTSIGLVNTIEHAEDVVNNLMRDIKIIFKDNAQLAAKPRVLGQGTAS